VIVVLLWFYVSGIAILIGAEFNAEIEHASPYGKAPGQKNAQGKLLIGARAARAFNEAPAGHGQPRVKEDDGQNGDGSKPVDFSAVSHQLRSGEVQRYTRDARSTWEGAR
jgi:hypothetical protein